MPYARNLDEYSTVLRSYEGPIVVNAESPQDAVALNWL